MLAPRLLLVILLPILGGVVAGTIYRGDLGGAWAGVVGGLFVGVMTAAVLFAAEMLLNRRHPLTPLVVGLLAAAVAFFAIRTAFQPPATVIFYQHFGAPIPDSVENLEGQVVYDYAELAVLLRFDVPPEDLGGLLERRDLQPQPEDEPVVLDLENFALPDWWDVDPHADHVEAYYTEVDFTAEAGRDYVDAPPTPDEHVPASEFFSRPGQLFYDTRTQTAYFADRSYWIDPEEEADEDASAVQDADAPEAVDVPGS